jgi:hypothetical protein
MANLPILRFNSGELTPQTDARSDVEKYSGGCRYLRNMIPRIYGSAERIPGKQYIYDATLTPPGIANTVVRMVPFVYSITVAYQIELGNKYARTFFDGNIVAEYEIVVYEDEQVFYEGQEVRRYEDSWSFTGDTWVSTPYLAADLLELYVKQIADTVWIVHRSYPPAKLTRTGVKTFELNEIDFRNGPFLTRNDLIDPVNPSTTTLTSSTLNAGSGGTITATADIFLPGHVGALFMLIHPRTDTIIEQEGIGTSDDIETDGDFTFNTHGTWEGTVKLQRNDNNAGWEDYRTYVGKDDRNIQLSSTEESSNVKYRIKAEGTASLMNEFRGDLTLNDVYRKGIVKATAYISPYKLAVEVYSKIESTDATKRWHEGAWSYVRGFPSCVTFFNERCVYSGAANPLEDEDFTAAQYPSLRV